MGKVGRNLVLKRIGNSAAKGIKKTGATPETRNIKMLPKSMKKTPGMMRKMMAPKKKMPARPTKRQFASSDGYTRSV